MADNVTEVLEKCWVNLVTLISCACSGTQIIAVISHPSKYCDLFSHSSSQISLGHLVTIYVQPSFRRTHFLLSFTINSIKYTLLVWRFLIPVLVWAPILLLGATVLKRPKYNRNQGHRLHCNYPCHHRDCDCQNLYDHNCHHRD